MDSIIPKGKLESATDTVLATIWRASHHALIKARLQYKNARRIFNRDRQSTKLSTLGIKYLSKSHDYLIQSRNLYYKRKREHDLAAIELFKSIPRDALPSCTFDAVMNTDDLGRLIIMLMEAYHILKKSKDKEKTVTLEASNENGNLKFRLVEGIDADKN